MPTCSTCSHWHKGERDPLNLTAPITGTCRGAPPQLMLVPTQQGIAQAVAYPTTPEDFPACALHPEAVPCNNLPR